MRLSQPLLAGSFFVAFGALVLHAGAALEAGTAADMGTGYVPRLLAWAAIAVGGVLLARAARGGGETGLPAPAALRPLVLVTGMTVAFAVLLPRLGLVATVLAIFAAAALSGERFRWPALLLVAAALALGTAALFAWALRLPIPVWPA
jgi:putative tricarboxylic transport membrane protein